MKFFLISLSFFLFPALASAAVLYPSPTETTVPVGTTFTMAVTVDSEGEDINAVQATLSYPTDVLYAVNVAKTETFLTLWPEEPSIDQKAGTVRFVGGIPNGTVAFRVPAVTVTFRALKEGNATVSMVDEASAVLLNDGFGTETSLTTSDAQVHIGSTDPLAVRILSSTHPDEDAWYVNRDVVFLWQTPPALLTSFLLSRDPEAVPDDIQEETSGSVSFPALTDGTWYFSLKQKFPGAEPWGPVSRRRVHIDGTPPETPYAAFITEKGIRALSFFARDNLSGVDHYDVRIRKPTWGWFPFFAKGAWVRRTSPYHLANNLLFESIDVRAVDEAGNSALTSVPHDDYGRHQMRFWLLVFVAIGAIIILPLTVRERRKKRRRI